MRCCKGGRQGSGQGEQCAWSEPFADFANPPSGIPARARMSAQARCVRFNVADFGPGVTMSLTVAVHCRQ
jgi:hypothetical protein